MSDVLYEAAEHFVHSCAERPDLGPLLRGWNVRVELHGDTHERVGFVVRDERVTMAVGGCEEGVRLVRVRSDSGLLTAILEGAADPGAAYLDGRIDLDGEPEDLIRLDIVVNELW